MFALARNDKEDVANPEQPDRNDMWEVGYALTEVALQVADEKRAGICGLPSLFRTRTLGAR